MIVRKLSLKCPKLAKLNAWKPGKGILNEFCNEVTGENSPYKLYKLLGIWTKITAFGFFMSSIVY